MQCFPAVRLETFRAIATDCFHTGGRWVWTNRPRSLSEPPLQKLSRAIVASNGILIGRTPSVSTFLVISCPFLAQLTPGVGMDPPAAGRIARNRPNQTRRRRRKRRLAFSTGKTLQCRAVEASRLEKFRRDEALSFQRRENIAAERFWKRNEGKIFPRGRF